MALITVVAGAYTATYQPNAGNGASGAGGSPANLGLLTDDGWELSWQAFSEEVRNTDGYARTLLDLIYQGADWRFRARFKEYSAAVMNLAWPWGKATGNLAPVLSNTTSTIGRRGTDVAGSLVLTATANTPAAGNPATLTCGFTILSPNNNFSMNFTSRVREVPAELVLLPYASGGNNLWFTVT